MTGIRIDKEKKKLVPADRCIAEVKVTEQWTYYRQCERPKAKGDYCLQHARRHEK